MVPKHRGLRLTKRAATIGALAAVLCLLTTVTAFAGDPNGAETLAASEDPTATALTFVWMMVTGTFVFFMQAGFAFLEAGFTRVKNLVNVLTKNFMDFCIGGLAYFFFGFAIMYGTDIAGLIGSDGFFLLGDYYDVSKALAWFFQMVFAATAATIVSGAMAERTKITAYLAYSFLISALIYPISGHWVWGGGWLSQMGFHDFAGSGVVHMIGGMVALTGAYLVGPRVGKYNKDGTPNEFKPTNVPYITLGGLILFFGWFGFNPGSTLNGSDLRMSVIAVNTFLAGCAGATTVMYARLISTGKADGVGAVNGALAGLVGITAGCAVVPPWAAVIIGLLSGFVLMWGEKFIERTLKVDDPVGAVTVHGLCGFFGLLMVGVFADGAYAGVSGLIAGNAAQLVTQLIGAVALAAWALITGLIMFAILKATMGLRASDEEQRLGLDLAEHGAAAYEPALMAGAAAD
ncbi:MAG TPA: ammonium transporter [Caldilineaceae bacterium]|nr:ammonium transporter [Caldilineaceae bacterium]